jgi:thiamine pyrophosphokinase
MPPANPLRIEIVGRVARAGRRARAAVVSLEGCAPADLRRALADAVPFDREPLLIAVDGGLATCRMIRRRPDLFVGDLDSAGAVPGGIPSVVYPVDKSFSDFAGALVEARRLGADVAVIAGLLGGRLDHEWANILELGAAAPKFAGLLAPSRRGLVVVTARGVRARGLGRRVVSVFALGRTARVSLRGTRWHSRKTGARLARPVEPGGRPWSWTSRRRRRARRPRSPSNRLRTPRGSGRLP